MNRFYVALFIFFSVTFHSLAQSPTINISIDGDRCADPTLKIDATVSGTFGKDNVFKARIRKSYQAEVTEFPAVLKNGKFEVSLPENLRSTGNSQEVQITASSPAITSNWSYATYFHTKGQVTISPALSDTINQYKEFSFYLNANSTSSGIVTLNDSSKVSFNADRDAAFQQIRRLYPEKSVNYTIAHAENVCGAMTVSGAARVYVNPVSIQTTLITPRAACPGSQIRVRFSADNGKLNDGTSYTVRLTESVDSGSPANAKKYYAQATLKDGELLATIPENISLVTRKVFTVSVMTQNPGTVGEAGAVYLWIHPKPFAEITSTSNKVLAGDGFDITVRYIGPDPYTIVLSDGTKIPGVSDVGQIRNHDLKTYPTATTEYTIKAIQSSCAAAALSQNKVVATVPSGLILPKRDITAPYCEGATVRLPFSANVDLPANARYSMKIRSPLDTVIVPAQRVGSEMEFKIPDIWSKSPIRIWRQKSFSFQLISENPRLESNLFTDVTIQGKPEVVWTEPNREVPIPAVHSFAFNYKGGGPYSLNAAYGTSWISNIYNDIGYGNFYITKSGQYALKSISNSCFSNDSPTPLNVKVLDESPSKLTIVATSIKYPACYGDTLDMEIGTTGQFPDDDEFMIQLNKSSSCCEFQTIKTVTKAGKIKVPIPYDEQGNISSGTASYYIKVVSKKTGVASEQVNLETYYPFYNLRLAYSDRTSLSGAGSKAVDMELSHLGGTPWSLTYSDGKQDHSVILDGNWYSSRFSVNVKHGANHFVVKSIRSACGVQNINLPANIFVDRYRVIVPSENWHMLICTGSTIRVPFEVMDTTLVSTTFKLQISKDNATFTDAGSNTTSRVAEYHVPADYAAGNYYMRVISSDGVFSNSFSLDIGSAPTATITSVSYPGSGPFEVEAGRQMRFDIETTGTVPQWIVADGLYDYNSNQNKFSTSIYPFKSGTFAIKSISNSCGYGPVPAAVSYKVLPKLTMQTFANTLCVEQGFTFSYVLQGDFDISDDYIRFSLINISTNETIRLDSTRAPQGTPYFQLPQGLESGFYILRGNIQKYKIQTDAFIIIDQKPRLTLLGNTTINPGGQTNLVIRSLNGSQGQTIRYTLSNGVSGEYAPSGNIGSAIMVAPQVTTHYQIVSANNQCGSGTIVGEGATVTVNPASAKSVEVTKWNSVRQYNFLCTTDTVQVYFTSIGTFSSSNKFLVQLSDSIGLNFKTLPTTGSASPLTAIIPGGMARSDGYRVRVIATDPDVAVADFRNPLALRYKPTVRFATDKVYQQGNAIPRAAVILTGDSPWQINYATSKSTFNAHLLATNDSISLHSPAPGEVYTLRSVSNGCGPGQVLAPASVTIELITATEPALPAMIAFPNPTREFVTVNFGKRGKHYVHLSDISGKLLASFHTTDETLHLDLRKHPSGILLLNVESGPQKSTFRIIRQ
ncbi:hypothetical protein J2Y45_003298 [Dyadobacter sp. BE34]|uniref:Secretion system C-terminal sorting domain-containing protein n=1 Tax=Dyadobacter fermentans TaxID=94254 RepID=A0ABU1QY74_9BACT|nr:MULTISPECIES: T9SS type A sorting domain-containing protein [Dyadobacter]MDR6806106.1 hypothetical protein [Dyadobacter fermentans]MDR7043847.1 hypothetical protein [Dyadobacter sp. BE242]MDR7198158.1 hypothetical protein [Dyadobacter sp. BE34]MDR7216121.1 hypothetical protein [Dyadobacter sp. BE31]MDR7264353.1 hypothetical protein [Dyadobacter sp. BE32]